MPGKPRIDLTGQRFGKLVAIEIAETSYKVTLWRCKCDCGGNKIVSINKLRKVIGGVKSCGCLWHVKGKNMNPNRPPFLDLFRDLVGQRFGRWRVIERDKTILGRLRVYWKCECDCGNIRSILSQSLLSGDTNSCGCIRREIKIGKNNPFWKGGKRKVDYAPEWNASLKSLIRSRDRYECQYPNCGMMDSRTLDVHHIDGNKLDCSLGNLISLCKRHHHMVETHRTDWENYFHTVTRDY